MQPYSYLFLFALLLSLSSCDNDYFFFEETEVSEEGWRIDTPAVFRFETQDTSSYLNFYLDIRNTEDYSYRNIYSFIDMRFPNGRTLSDTLHYPYLASQEGKWLGKGVGGKYDNSILYKRKRKLPLPGKYEIKVTHAMRDTMLLGIEKVGIHITADSER